MEFLEAATWITISKIILIDILLAGDNAVVIGMAAGKLAPELQKKALRLPQLFLILAYKGLYNDYTFTKKNISPPTTRRRDILHYFLSFFTNKDAPTTRITAPILMSNAYGSTVCEINLSSTLIAAPTQARIPPPT